MTSLVKKAGWNMLSSKMKTTPKDFSEDVAVVRERDCGRVN
jgi:hypothetical protein